MPHKNTLRSLILRVPDALPRPRVRPVPSLAGNTFAGIADRDSNFFPSVPRISFACSRQFDKRFKPCDRIAVLILPVVRHALSIKFQCLGHHVADGIAVTALFDVKKDVVDYCSERGFLPHLILFVDFEKLVPARQMERCRTAHNSSVIEPIMGDRVADTPSDKAARFAVMYGHVRKDSRISSLDSFQTDQFSSPCAFAFCQPSTLVWGDRPEPHRLSCPELAGRSSCRQPLVSQTLSVNCGDKRVQPLQRMPRHVASIQAEGDLIHVTANVLGAD